MLLVPSDAVSADVALQHRQQLRTVFESLGHILREILRRVPVEAETDPGLGTDSVGVPQDEGLFLPDPQIPDGHGSLLRAGNRHRLVICQIDILSPGMGGPVAGHGAARQDQAAALLEDHAAALVLRGGISAGDPAAADGIQDGQLRARGHADRASPLRGAAQMPVQGMALQIQGQMLPGRDQQRHVVLLRDDAFRVHGNGRAVRRVVNQLLEPPPGRGPDGGQRGGSLQGEGIARQNQVLSVAVHHPADKGILPRRRGKVASGIIRNGIFRGFRIDRDGFAPSVLVPFFIDDADPGQHRFLIDQLNPEGIVIAGNIGFVAVTQLVQVAGHRHIAGQRGRGRRGHADLRAFVQRTGDGNLFTR